MQREEARQILDSMMDSPALRAHVRSVEIVMEAYAEKFGEDRDRWAITGLLHDADYQKYPEEHPQEKMRSPMRFTATTPSGDTSVKVSSTRHFSPVTS